VLIQKGCSIRISDGGEKENCGGVKMG